MLFYNMEAGKMLKSAGMGVLRRHSMPELQRLEKYKQYPILEKLAYSSAEYCLAEEKDTMHFGLNSNAYAHASSPIRRYADLVNQRALKILIRGLTERYIVPQAMYDMNYKSKLNRGFKRDFNFLTAICNNQGPFKGIIIDRQPIDNDFVKIKLYIQEWSKTVSTKYKILGENMALSRDEKREIDITEFRGVEIQCAFNINARNWKERIIINIV